MEIQIDLRVTELLASRLCHDLVGPVGAVNNGLELLEDEEMGMADDALQLAAKSARQAADILQFYRLAYGMAGGRIGNNPEDLRKLASGYLESTKVGLDWQIGTLPESAPDGLGKLLLNIIMLAEEMLPRGGTLAVAATAGSAGVEAAVTVQGAGARVREESQLGLADDVAIEELTPLNVQGYFTRLLARRLGGDLSVETPAPDSLRFSVVLSP